MRVKVLKVLYRKGARKRRPEDEKKRAMKR